MQITHKFPDELRISGVIAPSQMDVLAKQITAAVKAELAAQLAPIQQEIKDFMNTFAQDESRLETDIQADTDAIKQVAGLVTADKTTITDLQTKLSAALAANTPLDLKAFESGLAKLEANNTALAGLAPAATPAPVVTPAPATPPVGTTPPAPTAPPVG